MIKGTHKHNSFQLNRQDKLDEALGVDIDEL